jgi:dTMP kinase
MYICIEGIDGVGKSTQCDLLSTALSALSTSEPGSKHCELTRELRALMLDAKYNMPSITRELISQAARAAHLANVVYPALKAKKSIVQDRGLLSGFAYGLACGHSMETLEQLASITMQKEDYSDFYDVVILLKGDAAECQQRCTKRKKEFKAGDAMEAKGQEFMKEVFANMERLAPQIAKHMFIIDVQDRSIELVHQQIMQLVKPLC